MHQRELDQAAERQRTGTRVLRRRAVLAQSWCQQPQSCEPRRTLRPRVASPNKWARMEALMRNCTFVDDYADARARWRDGVATAFPAPTGCNASPPCRSSRYDGRTWSANHSLRDAACRPVSARGTPRPASAGVANRCSTTRAQRPRGPPTASARRQARPALCIDPAVGSLEIGSCN
jgi:hypothetical protein